MKETKIAKGFKELVEDSIKLLDMVYGINTFYIVFIAIAIITLTGLCLHLEGIIVLEEGIKHFFVGGMTISMCMFGWISYLKDYKNRSLK